MPDQMPRQLAQIQDFSARAGEKVLDILGKQNPTSTIISDLIDRATRAYDSDQMAKAAALQESMRALGYNPDKIRGALAGAGFRDGIVGSKELQDRYEEANQAHIAKTTLDEQIRKARLLEDADRMFGELTLFKQEVPGGEHLWYQQNKDKLQANPYAMKVISAALANSDISIPSKLLTKDNLANITPNAVLDRLNQINTRLGRLSAIGIPTSLDPEEALKHTNYDAFVQQLIKEFGYEKDAGGAGDIRNNFYSFYNKAKGKYKNAPDSLIIAAARQYIDSELFPWDQEDVDEAPALEFIGKRMAHWEKDMNQANELLKQKEILSKAYKDDTVAKAMTNYNTLVNRLQTAPISDLAKQMALSKQVQSYNTMLAQIALALEESKSTLSRSINN